MRIRLLRNATLRVSYAGQEILIDPCFGSQGSLPTFAGITANPTVELPASIDEILLGVQLVVISHLHADHFDAAGQSALPRDTSLFCQPADLERILAKGFARVSALHNEAAWHGITFKRTDGQHGSGDILQKAGPVMGFVLKAPGEPTLYWCGDTVLTPDVLSIVANKEPDVIVTHSGGATMAGTLLIMDDAQTIQLLQNAGEAVVIAVHMEALDHCTVTRVQLRAAASAAGISESQLLIPADGQELEL